MNLEESNEFVEQMEKNSRNKRTVIMAFVILLMIVGILLGLIYYIRYKDAQVLKMFVDNNQVTISSTMLIERGGDTYVNIKELASSLGYSYQKGEYKNYTEDVSSCYLKTPYEAVSMSAGAQTATKYILNESDASVSAENAKKTKDENEVETELITQDDTTGEQTVHIIVDSKNETQETFYLEKPIEYINNELYVSFSELPRLFNVQLNTEEMNRIRIYSLDYLIRSATQVASNLGYATVSNTYENLTAMVDNMMVVGDGKSYGVVSLQTGQSVIGLKYEKVVYMQNTKEFLVTAEDSVGIMAANGDTIIKPVEYASISVLDELNKLYLVEKDGKYGVLNGDGETVIYAEYDQIGFDEEYVKNFPNEKVRNFDLLFDECIPVKKGEQYGLIDIEGNERLKCVYDSLGYVASRGREDADKKNKNNTADEEISNETSTDETAENEVTSSPATVDSDFDSVLTIPESVGIKGIVIRINGLYGLFDCEQKGLLIPCTYSRIYSKTKSGVTTYYLQFGGQDIELESFLEEQGLKTVGKTKQESTQESASSNEAENEVQDAENAVENETAGGTVDATVEEDENEAEENTENGEETTEENEVEEIVF